MSEDDKKFLALGRMVFSMITDVINTPATGTAYGRKRVTMPDGRGGKHAVVLMIAKTDELAEVWERAARESFAVADIEVPSERKQ